MTPRTERSPALVDRVMARLNRRTLITSGSLVSAGAVLGRVDLLRAAAQESPALGNTINAAITLEAFVVTFYGAARGGDVGMNDEVAQFARAAQCEEDAHFHFFEAAGAVPVTTSFTIPKRQLGNQRSFLAALLDVESLLVGMHMAVTRQFAAGGNLRLVEIGYQIGAVEAQHLALTRQFLGEPVPADRAFAQWMFEDPGEAVNALEDLGYIGGSGETVSYPGPVDRQCRGITGLVPETTEDKPADELPPAASPEPDARA